MTDKGAEEYLAFRECGDDKNAHFERIVRDFRDGLVLFLYQFLGDLNEAEDAAQDVFFRLYVKRPRFAPRASFRTWLYTIGKHEALDRLKKRKHAAAEEPGNLTDSDLPDPATELIADERRRALHRALGELNPDYRLVLYLHYFEELDNEQIAALTGSSRKAVTDRLSNARKSLRAIIQNGGKTYEILQTDDS